MRRRFRVRTEREDGDDPTYLVAPAPAEQWTCEPCGLANIEGHRLNCPYCGRPKPEE